MEKFFGKDDRSLDGKGRVILPARYRPSLAASVFITPHYERCLALWTPDEFDKEFEKMHRTQDLGAEGRNLARIWSATSAEEKIDGQGRVSIPPNLREFARLEVEAPVLVAGALDHIELWEPSAWVERIVPSEALLADPLLADPLLADPLLAKTPRPAPPQAPFASTPEGT